MAETKTKRNNAPSNVVLIVAALLVLTGIGIVNTINQKATANQMQDEHQDEQKGDDANKAPQTPAPSQAPSVGASELAGLGDDKTLGKADAKTQITIAWEWTPEVQGDPSKVYKAVQAAQTGAPDTKLRVVNTDAHPELKPGIYVNGRLFYPAPADGTLPAIQQAYREMAQRAAAGEGPPTAATEETPKARPTPLLPPSP